MKNSDKVTQNERDLFEATVRLTDEDERFAFLDGACHGNPELRHRIDMLLEGHFKSQGFLDTVLDDDSSGLASTVTEGPGTTIGDYKILEKIGEGGFGVVYMAEQQKPVVRKVALKIIKLGMDTKQVVARFEAERQALALMDHPNIAKVLGAGSTEAGRPYFVMELVRGIPLTKYCDENLLSTQERLNLFVDVCAAIQHAHQKGIIHRDIKPSNVLVTMHDDKAVPKVIDFGIAKATQGRLTEKTLFTQFQQFIGTPTYMSPEQAQMSGLDIDTRSDIYSLGVLLYELLTGKTPLDFQELLNAGYDEVRRRIREDDPPKPSMRLSALTAVELTKVAKHRKSEPVKLSKLVRGKLDWIVMKAMEKDRTRRYETANGFALDVRRHLEHEPIMAVAPSPLYRFQKFAQKNRGALATASVFAIVLISATIFRTQQARQVTIQRDEARLNSYVADVALADAAIRESNFGRARYLLEAQKPDEDSSEDFRGFEWRYLMGLWKQSGYNFEIFGYESGITGLDISNDGSMIATCNYTTLAVWDLAEGRVLFEHPTETRGAAILIDENRVAYNSSWGTAWIANIDSGQIEKSFTNVVGMVSPNHRWLPIRNAEALELYDLQSGDIVKGPEVQPLYLAETNRWFRVLDLDRYLLSYRVDYETGTWGLAQNAVLLDLDSNEDLSRLLSEHFFHFSLDFHQSSSRLAVGDVEGKVTIIDLNNRDVVDSKSMPGATEDEWMRRIVGTKFDRDGETLFVSNWNPEFFLWDLSNGEISDHMNLECCVNSASFMPDRERLATGNKDGSVRIWDIRPKDTTTTNLVFRRPKVSNNRVISQDSGLMVVRALTDDGSSHQLLVVDLPDTRVSSRLPTSDFALGFEHDGRRLLTVSSAKIQRWDLISKQPESVADLEKNVGEIAITPILSPNRRSLAIAGADKRVNFYDARNGTLLKECDALANTLFPEFCNRRVAFSPDSKRLAIACRDGHNFVELHYLEADRKPVALTSHNELIYSIAFSPDGRSLITAGSGDLVWWSLLSGENYKLKGHFANECFSVGFCPDGITFATTGKNRTKLWNSATRREVASVSSADYATVLFSNDEQLMILIGGVANQGKGGWSQVKVIHAPPLQELKSVQTLYRDQLP